MMARVISCRCGSTSAPIEQIASMTPPQIRQLETRLSACANCRAKKAEARACLAVGVSGLLACSLPQLLDVAASWLR